MLLLTMTACAQDPIGCGGFVRLPVGAKAPNFARMRVQLYNEQGNLRFVSDISPNGAYSLPVYERGTHRIRLTAPDGWNLEPESHSVAVLDQDSCQRDLDFRLIGYSVLGAVHTRGLRTGPPDLPLALTSRRSAERIGINVTDSEGNFVFSRVPPGEYLVRPDLPSGGGAAAFETDQLEVDVVNDNASPPAALVVKGFAMSAGISDVGTGAHLYLYSRQLAGADGMNCEKQPPHPDYRSPLSDALVSSPDRLLCRAVTGTNGVGHFSDVPGGEYTLVPFHPDYRIEPAQLSLRVRHSDLHMGTVFKAIGVLLRGRIVDSTGSPLFGARVRLVDSTPGAEEVDTDANGRFLLYSPERRSTWTVQVDYPEMLFLPAASDSLAFSADLRPERYRICGQAEGLGVRQVASLSAPEAGSVATEQDGSFCIYLPTGKHILRCGRAQREFQVSGPATGVVLKEQRVDISGRVVGCPAGQCPADLQVTLSGEETSTAKVASDGSFVLTGQLPGAYMASLGGGDLLCWAARDLQLSELGSGPVEKPRPDFKFRATGFKAFVLSSHDLELTYGSVTADAVTQPSLARKTLHVSQGRAELCLEGAVPPLQLLASSCHRLAGNTARIERPGESVSFTADAFLVRLAAEFPDGANETVRIELFADGKPAGQFDFKPGPKGAPATVDMHYPAGATLEARDRKSVV